MTFAPAGFRSDFIRHLRFAVEGVAGGGWPVHPLFHVLVRVLTLGSTNARALGWAAVAVATLSVVARQHLVFATLRRDAGPAMSAALAWALLFSAALPAWWAFPRAYLGQMHATVWHSPTYVLALPLAIATWLTAVRTLRGPAWGPLGAFALVGALSALAKPNFLITLIAPFTVGLLLVHGERGVAWSAKALALALLPPVAVLATQYVVQFGAPRDGRLVFAPMRVWRMYSPYPPISVALSTAFPLATLACFFRDAVRDRGLLLAWGAFGSGLVLFALLAEAPPSTRDGNLVWGAHAATAVLFLASAGVMLRGRERRLRFALTLGVLALHTGAGVFYFARNALGLGIR